MARIVREVDITEMYKGMRYLAQISMYTENKEDRWWLFKYTDARMGYSGNFIIHGEEALSGLGENAYEIAIHPDRIWEVEMSRAEFLECVKAKNMNYSGQIIPTISNQRRKSKLFENVETQKDSGYPSGSTYPGSNTETSNRW